MISTVAFTLLFSFAISLICLGVHNIFVGDNMLLNDLAEWCDIHLAFWLCKVLFACLPCMASLWGITLWLGSAVLLPFWDISHCLTILLTPAVVLLVSGFNVLFEILIHLVRHLTEK